MSKQSKIKTVRYQPSSRPVRVPHSPMGGISLPNHNVTTNGWGKVVKISSK